MNDIFIEIDWIYVVKMHILTLSEKLWFKSSQIATVTNSDKSGNFTVAICDLSQFAIKAIPW